MMKIRMYEFKPFDPTQTDRSVILQDNFDI